MQNKLWSNYQQNIFQDFAYEKHNTAIIARAGSGKTSTLLEGIKYIPKNKKILLIAFNKFIVNELKEKISSYTDISTVHSLGFAGLRSYFGKIKLNTSKTYGIALKLLREKYRDQEFDILLAVLRVVSLCKNYFFDTKSKIQLLIDNFNVYIPDRYSFDDFSDLVLEVLSQSKQQIHIIDFDDMVFHAILFNVPIPQYDVVLVDEAQDFSRINFSLALKAVKPDGRIIVFYDNLQQIYGWRGADKFNIDQLPTRLNAKILKLPISYRCAKNIVRYAQKFAHDIQHWDQSPEGIVKSFTEHNFLTHVRPTDFILSRTNAPLIKYCIQLLEQERSATIQGKDLGKNLSAIVQSAKKKNIKDFIHWLQKWKARETKNKSNRSRKYKNVIDLYDCLVALAQHCQTTAQMLTKIKKIFQDEATHNSILLSTIHSIKGKETDRVFVLLNTFKWEGQEEENCKYIAYTRAKKELYIIK